VDYSRLNYVYIIKNPLTNERLELESKLTQNE
jgi:hypothetical protein